MAKHTPPEASLSDRQRRFVVVLLGGLDYSPASGRAFIEPEMVRRAEDYCPDGDVGAELQRVVRILRPRRRRRKADV